MRKIVLFFMACVGTLASAQYTNFLYEYRSIPDTLDKKNLMIEIMVLSIDKEKSEFYSLNMAESDSTLLAKSKLGIIAMPPKGPMNTDRIIKRKGKETIEYMTIISYTKYVVDQKMDLQWQITGEHSTILNYPVQKATTSYGGRKWTAWFAKDIPVHDGPYKFCNLPGLILKIGDDKENHVYELKAIQNRDGNFVYPDLDNFKKVKITFPKFVELYKKYRKNPMINAVGSFVDFTDSNGVFHSAEQTFREVEKFSIERLKKDNNIIEINLLETI